MFRRLLIGYAVRKKLKQELADGRLTPKEYKRLARAATSKVCESAVDSITAKGGLGDGVILSQIVAFVKENWFEILKILITLSSLVMDGEDE